jgi:hypothetical protein
MTQHHTKAGIPCQVTEQKGVTPGFEATEGANTLRINVALTLSRFFSFRAWIAIFVFLCVGNFASAQSISNGGFESSLSGWSQTGSFYTFNNPAKAYSGS